MPRRIDAETDMKILADVGLGMLYKDVAAKYNVSPSYITKLTSGKKALNIRVPEPAKVLTDAIEAYEDDINAIVEFIEQRQVLVTNDAIVKYLNAQITRAAIRIKIYTKLLNKYKNRKEN